jgi:hypothetical protein
LLLRHEQIPCIARYLFMAYSSTLIQPTPDNSSMGSARNPVPKQLSGVSGMIRP